MKPYAFDPDHFNDTGCCPGHDWPRCHRWAGSYNSRNSARADAKLYAAAKRQRRRRDKHRLGNALRGNDGE